MKISVVSPVYMGASMLDALVEELKDVLDQTGLDYEVVLVNDASPDNSWEIITSLCQNFAFVKGINLSRNFGQHSAILAGLTECNGDVCVVMDCDLQDDPKYILDLLYLHMHL